MYAYICIYTYIIDLTIGNFHTFLGSEAKTCENNEQIAEYIANLDNDSNDIYVHCDIIEGMKS